MTVLGFEIMVSLRLTWSCPYLKSVPILRNQIHAKLFSSSPLSLLYLTQSNWFLDST